MLHHKSHHHESHRVTPHQITFAHEITPTTVYSPSENGGVSEVEEVRCTAGTCSNVCAFTITSSDISVQNRWRVDMRAHEAEQSRENLSRD